jgi:hypothetical protein
MYRLTFLSIPLALACSTPKYDYDEGDSGLTLTNSDADDSNADDEEEDDSDSEPPDDDGSNDTDEEEEEEEEVDPDNCSHPYNPIDKTSWEKTYSAVFISDNSSFGTATATEQGMGTGYTSSGVETFKTWDTLTTSTGKGWEGSIYHNCDNSDGTKLSVLEWNVMLTFEEVPGGSSSALMILSTPRTYLADKSKIGTGESWNFNYSLTYTDTSGSMPIEISVPVSGSYTDKGMAEKQIMGETMDAWHIQSEYNMDLLTIPALEDGFTRAYPGKADYYWVEDIGLVYEKHVDTGTGATILEKTLIETLGL